MWVNLPGGIPKVRVPWVDLESILPHDHVQVDTALEYACLGVATALALLVLWLWYEIEASPVFEAQLLFRARRERGPPVLVPGKYDPPHYGHVALLRAAAARHGTVVAYVAAGTRGLARDAVPAARRADLLRAAVEKDAALSGRVEVVVAEGPAWRAARARACAFLVRGVRSARDRRYASLYLVADLLAPLCACSRPVPTIYVEAPPKLATLTAAAVRAALLDGGSLDGLVPPAIRTDVRTLYSPKVKGG